MIKSLVAAILILGLIYTIHNTLSSNKETLDKENDENYSVYDFSLQDLDGNEISLSDFKGRSVVLNFWATYCPPCEKEMPYLNNIYEEYKKKGIEVLAVNAKEPRIIVSPFVKEKNLKFPVLLDRTGTTVDQYKVLNLPVTLFIDENGTIIERFSGELTEKKIRNSVEQIVP
ncbi:thiol-disulfide oxidoreductase ResA [Priestia megaterium]|uniref:thiol-disulfide oxidoreductase ResA n=1 Tax=Priestia megaterium TaxID=1404 RepID=UPI002A6A5F59|nr:thiol-disulfide oxidoreductase ResA [Priestia megaterium]MDY0943199.1 thiol-disulfide oxidoreductase ResA [Priestia megaterium]